MITRRRALAGAGTIINFSVPYAPLVFGSLPGKLFIPQGATAGVALPLLIYNPSAVGTDNNHFVGVTTLGIYCAGNPANVPFYVWAPQMPLGNSGDSVLTRWQAVRFGISYLAAQGYRIDSRKMTLSGYSAGGTPTAMQVYSYLDTFAGWAPHDGGWTVSRFVTPSLRGDDPSGYVMDPATTLTVADTYTQFGAKLVANKCSVLYSQGDSVTDSAHSLDGLFSEIIAHGGTVNATSTQTWTNSDKFIQSKFPGLTHSQMEQAPFSTSILSWISWVNSRVRT